MKSGILGRADCTLCGAECESVVHVLWNAPPIVIGETS